MEDSSIRPKSLSLPWYPRIFLWAFTKVMDLVLRKDGTVNRGLLKLVDFRVQASSKPNNGVKTHDVVVDPTRKLWFRVFVPIQDEKEDLPVIMFFHGGGYVLLAADSKIYDDFGRWFAKELSAIVISADYRLAPEHKHPAQLNDGLDVLKFLDNEENRSQWLPKNANISRCFIAGDSAGGNLAHHVTQTACEFNFQQLKVIGLVAIQPFFGGQERTNSEIELDGGVPLLSIKRTDWFWNAFMSLDEVNNRDNPIINVSGPNAVDISRIDLPETMLVVAGFDILHDWQLRYYNWLKKSGKEAYLVQYPNMFHGFTMFPELPESKQFISELKEFVHKVLNKVK